MKQKNQQTHLLFTNFFSETHFFIKKVAATGTFHGGDGGAGATVGSAVLVVQWASVSWEVVIADVFLTKIEKSPVVFLMSF